MRVWEWECVANYLQECVVTHAGPLYGPVNSVKVFRDEELRLILETTSNLDGIKATSETIAGTVKRAVDEVFLSGPRESTAVATGVVSLNCHETHIGANLSRTEISRVHLVEWQRELDAAPEYTIQWLENMPEGFLWPHAVQRKSVETVSARIIGESVEIVLNESDSSTKFGRTCVQVSAFGYDFFLVKMERVDIPNTRSPGFVLYKGALTCSPI